MHPVCFPHCFADAARLFLADAAFFFVITRVQSPVLIPGAIRSAFFGVCLQAGIFAPGSLSARAGTPCLQITAGRRFFRADSRRVLHGSDPANAPHERLLESVLAAISHLFLRFRKRTGNHIMPRRRTIIALRGSRRIQSIVSAAAI